MTVIAPIFLENDTTNQTSNVLRLFVHKLFGGRGGVLYAADLAVSQRAAGANMSVDVAAGTSINPGTEGSGPGTYVVHNNAVLNVAVTASNPTNPRNDLVITRVRDSFYSGANNDAGIVVVAGTPSGSPVDPDLDALGFENYQKLARVVVGAGVTSITNANIADLRTRPVAAGGIANVSTSSAWTSPVADDFVFDRGARQLLVRNAANSAYETVANVGAGITYASGNPFNNLILGSGGVTYGRYTKFGRLVVVFAGVQLGTGGDWSSTLEFTLPFTAASISGFSGNDASVGGFCAARAFANGGPVAFQRVSGTGVSAATTMTNFVAAFSSNVWTFNQPFDWSDAGSGSKFQGVGVYEATT